MTMRKYVIEANGQNGRYLARPCTAKELIEWINAINPRFIEGPCGDDAIECLNACREYLEWYMGE